MPPDDYIREAYERRSRRVPEQRSPAAIVYIFIAIFLCAPFLGFVLWILRNYVVSRW